MNEKLSKQILNFSKMLPIAVKDGMEKASKDILKRSTLGMRRVKEDIAVSRATGREYYRRKNRTRTLRVLSGSLLESLNQASEGKNNKGGIFKVTSKYDTLVEFGTGVKSPRGFSYPSFHDGRRSKFKFLKKLVRLPVYIKAIKEEVNKINV